MWPPIRPLPEEEAPPRHPNSGEVTSAEKMRAFRKRARKKKLCIGCGQVPPRKGKTKCQDCSEAAKAAVYRAREAKD